MMNTPHKGGLNKRGDMGALDRRNYRPGDQVRRVQQNRLFYITKYGLSVSDVQSHIKFSSLSGNYQGAIYGRQSKV